MKTKSLCIVLIVLLSIFAISCKDPDYCDSCRTQPTSDEKAAFDKELHPRRTILCSEVGTYQFYHSDVLNGFEIVGMTTECTNGIVTKITFNLMEVGNCKRYKIENVEWMETNKLEGYTHHLRFTINTIEKGELYAPHTFNNTIKFSADNLTKISIDSNDPGVVIPPVITDPQNRGPIACPVYVTGG